MSGCSLSTMAQNLLWQNRVVEKEISFVPLPVIFPLFSLPKNRVEQPILFVCLIETPF